MQSCAQSQRFGGSADETLACALEAANLCLHVVGGNDGSGDGQLRMHAVIFQVQRRIDGAAGETGGDICGSGRSRGGMSVLRRAARLQQEALHSYLATLADDERAEAEASQAFADEEAQLLRLNAIADVVKS